MFTLTLVTPEKKIVAGAEIEEVFVPGFAGELNILPGHAPLMTNLETGVLRYRLKGESKTHSVAVSWGYCQVNPLGVNVLAETAELPEDIDLARAEATLKSAEAMLNSSEVTAETMDKYRNKVARAHVRKDVAALKSN